MENQVMPWHPAKTNLVMAPNTGEFPEEHHAESQAFFCL